PQPRRPQARFGDSLPSSSLDGMEKPVPSFTAFVKTTPPPTSQKPLPPPPTIPERAPSVTPEYDLVRRSSSIYSRPAVSWMAPDSWQKEEIVEPEFFLQPGVYSSSTPHLLKRQPTPPLLQPRTYSPLIPSPSSTPAPSPSPSPPTRPSILLPPSPPSIPIPAGHKRVVSLEKKQQPSPMSPEASSPDWSPLPTKPPQLRKLSAAHSPPQLSRTPPNLLQARKVLLNSPPTSQLLPTSYHSRNISQEKALVSLGIDAESQAVAEDYRGRSKQRNDSAQAPPRQRDYSHYIQHYNDFTNPFEERSNAQQLSEQYHALLTDQYRQENHSPTRRKESDDVRTHMKMVPQPLFSSHRRTTSKFHSLSHKRGQSDGQISPTSPRKDSTQSIGRKFSLREHIRMPSLPLRISLDSMSNRRRSTSGSIPISPPFPLETVALANGATTSTGSAGRRRTVKGHRKRNSSTAFFTSAFHSRKTSGTPEPAADAATSSSRKTKDPPYTAPLPLLASTHTAPAPRSAPRTPASPAAHSHARNKLSSGGASATSHSSSSTTATTSPTSIYKRVGIGAAKWGDSLARPAVTPTPTSNSNPTPASNTARPLPHSPTPPKPAYPHIFAPARTPAAPRPDALERVRAVLRARAAASPSPGGISIVHHVLPARPLNGAVHAATRKEGDGKAKGVFGLKADARREGRAEKRREELKRLIRVVPEPGIGKAAGGAWV
ncbi:hypothetical protein LTR16_002624, partial [Cryomyces antarcticus]